MRAWFKSWPDTWVEFIHRIWAPLLALSIPAFSPHFPAAAVDLKPSQHWFCKPERLSVLCWSFSCCWVVTATGYQGQSCRMAILFFPVPAPDPSRICLLLFTLQCFLPNKTFEKFCPEFYFLSAGRLGGQVGVCLKQKPFFLTYGKTDAQRG